MKGLKIASVCFLLFLLSIPVLAQIDGETPFRIQRLSDRVLLLTENSPMENIIVAMASKKGLVVVDVSGSPYTAAVIRRVIEREFGRDDFAYVIDTHHHWDHAWGNQVFSDVKIVGHENCVEHIRRAGENINQTVANFSRNLDEVRVQLKNLDPSTEEAQQLMLREQFLDRVHRGLSEGFTATPPTITFNDRLTLDLDDLTLKLIYFGRAHSDGDILIQVPEEELLLTGDLFLDIGWLPLFAGQPVLDIPRWIDVLSAVLDGEDEVTRVIPGHRKMWTREKFDMWREYIVDLWQGVNRAKAEGLTIEGVLDRFPLEEKYFYLKELGHTDAALERFQTRNVEAFWRQLFESAATIVEETLNESGIDAARQKFHELRSEGSDTVFFGENEFNALGYRLMGSGRIKEAIEIFKLNVEVYPNSWNVYDSLGEAYMNDGQRELAIENYRKSLELNPENSNGREMLKRLEGEE